MPHGKKQQLTHFTNKHITYYLPHIKHYTLLPLTLHITLKWVTHNTKKLTHHAKTSNTRYKGLASMNVETASQCFKVDFKPPINFWKCVCEEEQMRKKGQHTWFYNAKFW
jgi:hypothetical protein